MVWTGIRRSGDLRSSTPLSVRTNRGLGIFPVQPRGTSSHGLAVLYHDQECGHTCQSYETSGDEAIRQAHVGIPRSYGIRESEANCIPDDDDGGHRFASDLLEAVDSIGKTDTSAYDHTKSHHQQAEDKTDPMYVVVGSHTPSDQTDSGEEAGYRKWPQTVFRFSGAIYTSVSKAFTT